MKFIKSFLFALLLVGLSGSTWAAANCAASEEDQVKPKSIDKIDYKEDKTKLPITLGNSEWGKYAHSHYGASDFKTEVYYDCDNKGWATVLTKATVYYHIKYRLLPAAGNRPVIEDVTSEKIQIQTSVQVLQALKKGLADNQYGNTAGGARMPFYSLAAVKAHETLHHTIYKDALDPAYTTFKTAIEATILDDPDYKEGKDLAQAKAFMEKDYLDAVNAFKAAEAAAHKATLHKLDGGTAVDQDFIDAEKKVTGPLIIEIDKKIKELENQE